MSEREKKVPNMLCLKVHSGFQNSFVGSVLSSDEQCWRIKNALWPIGSLQPKGKASLEKQTKC